MIQKYNHICEIWTVIILKIIEEHAYSLENNIMIVTESKKLLYKQWAYN